MQTMQLRLTTGAVLPILLPGAASVLGMDINNKIDLGQLIIALTSIVGVILWLASMKGEIKNLGNTIKEELGHMGSRLTKVETEMAKQTEILIVIGRQEEKMAQYERRQASVDAQIQRLSDELGRIRTFGVQGAPRSNETVIGRDAPSF